MRMKSLTVQTRNNGSNMTLSNSLSKSPKKSKERSRSRNFKDTMPIEDF